MVIVREIARDFDTAEIAAVTDARANGEVDSATDQLCIWCGSCVGASWLVVAADGYMCADCADGILDAVSSERDVGI